MKEIVHKPSCSNISRVARSTTQNSHAMSCFQIVSGCNTRGPERREYPIKERRRKTFEGEVSSVRLPDRYVASMNGSG